MLPEGGGVCRRREGVGTTGSGWRDPGPPDSCGALAVLRFLCWGDRPFRWERREGFVLGGKDSTRCVQPRRFVPLGLVSYHPLAGRKKLAGADSFGRTTSGVLFSRRPQWQGTGSGGLGGTGRRSKGRFQRSVRGREARPKPVLSDSSSEPNCLNYKSSQALPRGPSATTTQMRRSGKGRGSGEVC